MQSPLRHKKLATVHVLPTTLGEVQRLHNVCQLFKARQQGNGTVSNCQQPARAQAEGRRVDRTNHTQRSAWVIDHPRPESVLYVSTVESVQLGIYLQYYAEGWCRWVNSFFLFRWKMEHTDEMLRAQTRTKTKHRGGACVLIEERNVNGEPPDS